MYSITISRSIKKKKRKDSEMMRGRRGGEGNEMEWKEERAVFVLLHRNGFREHPYTPRISL